MKILWSDFASKMLREVYTYHKDNTSVKVAKKIKSDIFSVTKQLILYPNSGQIELNLQALNEEHRYLVIGNYKIIYKKVKEGVLITDVFDSRQDPVNINIERK